MAQGQTAYALTAGNGSKFVDDTSAHAGHFWAIEVMGDAACVVSSSGTTGNIEDHDVDITLSAGQTIYGRWSQVTLASGSALLYKL